MDNTFLIAMLGMLVMLGVLFMILLVLLLRVRERQGAKRMPVQPVHGELAAARVARVAVVWPEEGKPLMWAVDGKRYSHPSEVHDPEHRLLLDTFLEIFNRTLPSPPATPDDELKRPLAERLRASFAVPRSPSSVKVEGLQRLDTPAIPRLEELDELVRTRLGALPQAPATSIRAGQDGLLQIVVAGQVYEQIDDIPFEDVRRAMRDAVRVWENEMG
jgi:hypothetical protein